MTITGLSLPSSLLWVLIVASLSAIAHAQVPANETFRYVNEGEFGPFITEYDASYRTTPLFGAPFQLAWYNTTPGKYYLGLRMGLRRSESLFRWVWDANRGRPVGENATLMFGTNGNLVLAEANGKAVWSTGTANKGVVGIKILPTGNIVLFNKQGKFLWQSFDHPTDTLFVGQSLFVGGPTKIVSRRSAEDNSDGIYSFVLDPKKGLNLFLTPTPKSTPLLYSSDRYAGVTGGVQNITFAVEQANEGAAYELQLQINTLNGGSFTVARPKYNATQSILRIAVNGNLETYTYYDPVDFQAWERVNQFFGENGDLPGCGLPTKCGSLGLCEDEMCVACPTTKGPIGWSKKCAPPTLGASCKTGAAVDYYKVVGVETFIPKFNKGIGKVKVQDCKTKCSADCACLGFFYWQESSTCWLAPVLGSLSSVSNSSHVAYIKYSK